MSLPILSLPVPYLGIAEFLLYILHKWHIFVIFNYGVTWLTPTVDYLLFGLFHIVWMFEGGVLCVERVRCVWGGRGRREEKPLAPCSNY